MHIMKYCERQQYTFMLTIYLQLKRKRSALKMEDVSGKWYLICIYL